jgi:hypothetical protein
MLNIKNIFLTTSLSFLLGFYSICHLFIYIKRIEDVGNQNRTSFKEINFVLNEYENKYNKLQFEVIHLRCEINKLKKVVNNMKKNVESSFISPLSVSSLGTLDLSIDENVVCDELCDFNQELNEFHNLRSQGTSFTTNLVDDSNIDFDNDYFENNVDVQNNINNNENTINNDNDENIITNDYNLEQTTSSLESINYLKSIFGYEMVDTNNLNETNNRMNYKQNDNNINYNINTDINTNNNSNLNRNNNRAINNNFNYNDLDVNYIIKDENSINSYESKSRKRSLSVSDVNWVGLTKKFIFG